MNHVAYVISCTPLSYLPNKQTNELIRQKQHCMLTEARIPDALALLLAMTAHLCTAYLILCLTPHPQALVPTRPLSLHPSHRTPPRQRCNRRFEPLHVSPPTCLQVIVAPPLPLHQFSFAPHSDYTSDNILHQLSFKPLSDYTYDNKALISRHLLALRVIKSTRSKGKKTS